MDRAGWPTAPTTGERRYRVVRSQSAERPYQPPRTVTASFDPVGSALPIFQALMPICG